MDLQRLDQEHKDLTTRYRKALEQVKILESRSERLDRDALVAPLVAGPQGSEVYRQLLEVERLAGRQQVERLAQQEAGRVALEDKLAATRASLSVATSQVT